MKESPILEKLSTLEQLIKQNNEPLSFRAACKYLDVSKAQLYKLTHQNKITHFKPNGKMIYFSKSDLNAWLFRNKKSSMDDLERKAIEYVINNPGGSV